jgi:dolichol-phosphate mannosyltransferase
MTNRIISTQKKTFQYSIILPIHNEEDCLLELMNRILKAMSGLGKPFEIICVDDGSTDQSWNIIREFNKKNSYVKGIKFLRNFGHQSAIHAGIKDSSGELIAVLDADGQDPPEILPEMFKKCSQGYDVVYAVRKNRKENLFKRMAYKIFYRFYKLIVPFDVPLDSGDFSVFNRKVADFLQSLPEKNLFMRGLRSWYGGNQTDFVYDRQKRFAGKTKYGFKKIILLAVNASISFSKTPLRLISMLGIIVSTLSFCAGMVIILRKLTADIPLLGWTSTIVLIIFFGGLNLFVLGIIGEYIGNIFDEVKCRPNFLIEQRIGSQE